MTDISNDLLWWITVVDLPAMAGLLLMIWRTRSDTSKAISHIQITLDRRCDQLRDALYAFKLEVAKSYASQKDLRNVENRIIEHLLRIEAKLDKTIIKTAELKGKRKM
ncbi:MAG: hypothetical protein COB36_03955 [Alphaproteobacteria bacterium]|nr:MAG: hypothetical protein COB36_03955 [Alphaproteobacteria bacterium]